MAKWITVEEAAEALHVSESQVMNRIRTGKLKSRRKARIWFVHSSLSEPTSEEESFVSKKFVLQVSNWVSCIDELSHIERDFRQAGIAYIIARHSSGSRVALFRQAIPGLNIRNVEEPPKRLWIKHYDPNIEKSRKG